MAGSFQLQCQIQQNSVLEFPGIKAIIPEKNILIDNSFEESYPAADREFKFDGGPAHE